MIKSLILISFIFVLNKLTRLTKLIIADKAIKDISCL